jgi:hypothetical protein
LELVVSITGRIVQRIHDARHISENIEVRGGDSAQGIYRRGVSEQWIQAAAFASSCPHFLPMVHVFPVVDRPKYAEGIADCSRRLAGANVPSNSNREHFQPNWFASTANPFQAGDASC